MYWMCVWVFPWYLLFADTQRIGTDTGIMARKGFDESPERGSREVGKTGKAIKGGEGMRFVILLLLVVALFSSVVVQAQSWWARWA